MHNKHKTHYTFCCCCCCCCYCCCCCCCCCRCHSPTHHLGGIRTPPPIFSTHHTWRWNKPFCSTLEFYDRANSGAGWFHICSIKDEITTVNSNGWRTIHIPYICGYCLTSTLQLQHLTDSQSFPRFQFKYLITTQCAIRVAESSCAVCFHPPSWNPA